MIAVSLQLHPELRSVTAVSTNRDCIVNLEGKNVNKFFMWKFFELKNHNKKVCNLR